MTVWSRLVAAGRVLANRTSTPDEGSRARVYAVGRTPSGVWVDADSALRNAVVWACVRYLTNALAQLPWRVLIDAASGPVRASANPVDWLISQRPNPEMGSFTWRQTMLGWVLRHGNAYAEIEWNNRGQPHALWPIHPDRVCPRRGADGQLQYEVWNQGGNVTIAARDIFHVRGLGDGVIGMSVVEYAAQSIGWAQATELFGSSYFRSGANATGVVEQGPGKALTPEAMALLKAEFNKFYGGANGEKTIFLDNGMKFTKVSADPDEGQFIETRQHQVEEICRWFGVPPHKVMHLLRSTFSNIEHQSIEVVIDSVVPWIKVFEEEANYKLFGGNRQGFYTKIDTRGLLRGDAQSRGAYYKILHELGVPVNRILELEDMPGIGADGEVSFVSNNVQTIERAIHGDSAPAEEAPDLSDPDAVERSLNRLN